jgi:hypothetical protein
MDVRPWGSCATIMAHNFIRLGKPIKVRRGRRRHSHAYPPAPLYFIRDFRAKQTGRGRGHGNDFTAHGCIETNVARLLLCGIRPGQPGW